MNISRIRLLAFAFSLLAPHSSGVAQVRPSPPPVPRGTGDCPCPPERQIALVAPANIGSSFDQIARSLQLGLKEAYPQETATVVNAAGIGDAVGKLATATQGPAFLVADANLMLNTMARFGGPAALSMDKLVPVGVIASVPWAIVTGAQSKYSDFKSLASSDKVNVATATTAGRASVAQLAYSIGRQWSPVPFKSSPEALAAAASGQVDIAMVPAGVAVAAEKAGKVRVLAVSSKVERGLFSSQPKSLEELGFKTSDLNNTLFLYVSAGDRQPSVKNWAGVLDYLKRHPAVESSLRLTGAQPDVTPSARASEANQREVQKWSAVLKQTKIVTE